MEVVECELSGHLDEIKYVKEIALKDVNAFDEDDLEPDYSSFDCFLLGRQDGKVVATAGFREPENDVRKALRISDSTAELKNMHVLPDFQRRGYATELINIIESKASEHGYSEIVLRTTSAQPNAQKFYKSNGYSELRRSKPDDRETNYKLVFFKKNL